MRNLSFLALLISLITYVYYSEELGEIQENEQKLRDEQIYDATKSGKLLGFSSVGVDFNKAQDGQFLSVNDLPISQAKVTQFFNQLFKIQVIRVLSSKELKEIGPSLLIAEKPPWLEFKLEHNHLKISLGNKISFNKKFYLKVENERTKSTKWMIVSYVSTFAGTLKDRNDHRSSSNYDQVKRIFEIVEAGLIDYQLFRGHEKLRKITIKSIRNKEYTVDLENKRTLPAADLGIKELSSRFSEYEKTLLRTIGSKIITSAKLTLPIGKLIVNGRKYSFYKRNKNKNGYFVEAVKYTYQISQEQFRALFEPQQFFWNRKLGSSDFSTFKILGKSGEVILESKISDKNIWAHLLVSKAHYVVTNGDLVFDFNYRIISKTRELKVRTTGDGVDILDISSNVIFHFLEKIK